MEKNLIYNLYHGVWGRSHDFKTNPNTQKRDGKAMGEPKEHDLQTMDLGFSIGEGRKSKKH